MCHSPSILRPFLLKEGFQEVCSSCLCSPQVVNHLLSPEPASMLFLTSCSALHISREYLVESQRKDLYERAQNPLVCGVPKYSRLTYESILNLSIHFIMVLADFFLSACMDAGVSSS